MSTLIEIKLNLIEPLTKAGFGSPVPKGGDDIAVLEAWYEDFKDYSAVTLMATAIKVRRTWERSGFPSIAFVRKVADTVAEETSKARSYSSGRDDSPEPAPIDIGTIMRTPIGKLAIKEGWAYDLEVHTRRRQTNFSQEDIASMRNARSRCIESLRSLGEDDIFNRQLRNIWQAMEAREADLARKYA